MRLKLQLRRHFYQLPTQWQLRSRYVKQAVLGPHDCVRAIKRLRLKEQEYLTDTAIRNGRQPNRKRILICSFQQFSPWVELEYSLATALRLRGHDVRGILCDGLLPLCEMNLGPKHRPPCATCIGWSGRFEDAFGFKYARLTDFLSQQDLAQAERLVEKTVDGDLEDLIVNGVPVGRLARWELQRYYRGFVFDPVKETPGKYRQWISTGVLLTWLFERVVDHERPDILLVSSGKTLPTKCALDVALRRGVRVVTWDTSPFYPNGVMFSQNKPAVNVDLEEEWKQVANEELSLAEIHQLNGFLRRWSRSETTPFPYNPTPVEDQQIIRGQLKLRPASPLVLAFTNTSWDMAVVDRDVGFQNMYDWIFGLVNYAVRRPDIDLVVRAHPAETRVPADLQSRTLVTAEIRKRFNPLPSNIKLVDADSPISSYALAAMAQVAVIYTSILGLELALRGKRPWIAGANSYRGKGFTLDLASKEHMYELLDANFSDKLSENEVKLAQKFAYLWIFRHVFRNRLIDPVDKRFSLSSFRELAPGGLPFIDDLCDSILAGKPFIDIGYVRSRPLASGLD